MSATDALDACKKGVGPNSLKLRIEAAREDFSQNAAMYAESAEKGKLYQFSPLLGREAQAVVIANLTKKELVDLYEYYLRGTGKPGRAVYDKLIVAAKDKCPFCGGIGRPRNLDHFLPKSAFPQFSILPLNLIPACRDCNMDGKAGSYATTAESQILHPYLDDDCFFSERWVVAQVVSINPCSVEYFVQPPDQWDELCQKRVEAHFHDFDLKKRYSIQAAEELTTITSQRKGFMIQASAEEFSAYLSSVAEAPLFVNHWKKVLYLCLANDESFCSHAF